MDKKFNILLVLCGGTICTTVSGDKGKGVRYIDEKKEVALKLNYYKSDSPFKDCVHIKESRNMGILSENMTVEKWNEIVEVIKNTEGLDAYDGIIIAHGTDTLAYSASLFSLVLKCLKKPVFLVSSQLPLDEEGANGNDNFKAAADLICKGIRPGVYVTYRNPADGIMYLHMGSRLLQCRPYDENFYSRGSIALTDDVIADDMKPTVYDEKMGIYSGLRMKNCVLNIEPYVGLDYGSYNYDGYRAVLHRTYHSGTLCEDVKKLIAMEGREFTIYVTPSDMSGEIYASTDNISGLGEEYGRVEFLYGMTDEMAYVKLMLAYSMGDMSEDEILEFMRTDVAGEYM